MSDNSSLRTTTKNINAQYDEFCSQVMQMGLIQKMHDHMNLLQDKVNRQAEVIKRQAEAIKRLEQQTSGRLLYQAGYRQGRFDVETEMGLKGEGE